MGLTSAYTVFTLVLSYPTEIETQNRNAQPIQSIRYSQDHSTLHVASVQRVRMGYSHGSAMLRLTFRLTGRVRASGLGSGSGAVTGFILGVLAEEQGYSEGHKSDRD